MECKHLNSSEVTEVHSVHLWSHNIISLIPRGALHHLKYLLKPHDELWENTGIMSVCTPLVLQKKCSVIFVLSNTEVDAFINIIFTN